MAWEFAPILTALAVIFLGALAGGRLASLLRVPQVSGYLLVGLAAGGGTVAPGQGAGRRAAVTFHGLTGGMVPSPGGVLTALRRLYAITAPLGAAPVVIDEPDPIQLVIDGISWERPPDDRPDLSARFADARLAAAWAAEPDPLSLIDGPAVTGRAQPAPEVQR